MYFAQRQILVFRHIAASLSTAFVVCFDFLIYAAVAWRLHIRMSTRLRHRKARSRSHCVMDCGRMLLRMHGGGSTTHGEVLAPETPCMVATPPISHTATPAAMVLSTSAGYGTLHTTRRRAHRSIKHTWRFALCATHNTAQACRVCQGARLTRLPLASKLRRPSVARRGN